MIMKTWNLRLEELEARVVPSELVTPGSGLVDQDPNEPGLQKEEGLPPQSEQDRPFNEQQGEFTPIGND
jgi:hypothetical protein